MSPSSCLAERIWARSHLAVSHLLASSRAAAAGTRVGCLNRVGKGVSPTCGLPSLFLPMAGSVGSAGARWALHRDRDACLLSCCPTTPLRPCFSPREGKGLLDVPGMVQGWGGRRQSLLAKCLRAPCVLLSARPLGIRAQGQLCNTAVLCLSSPGVFGVPGLHCFSREHPSGSYCL